MKIAIILNGISLSKNQFYKKILPTIRKNFVVEVFETVSVNDAVSLASKATQKKFDVIVATGGDGTVHQVLNGILKNYNPPTKLPVLAVFPFGSGNDFARTIGVSDDVNAFIEALQKFDTRDIDVGEVKYSVAPLQSGVTSIQETRYFVNVVDVGMGPSVVRKVLNSGRPLGSALAYYQSIISTFFSYRPIALNAASKDWKWRNRMRTFAIANAQYYGNGLCIAPDAKVNDGVFDIFACGEVSVIDFILHSIPLKAGRRIKHSKVQYLKSRDVELSSDEPLEIEADGEIIGWLPARVKISEVKLKIIKG